MSQLLEKKMKIRDGKKTPYQFSLFSCRSYPAQQTFYLGGGKNETFIYR